MKTYLMYFHYLYLNILKITAIVRNIISSRYSMATSKYKFISKQNDDSSDEELSEGTVIEKTIMPRKNSNDIFRELITRQLDNVPSKWRLNVGDMERVCKYIDNSIFDANSCCLWKGYVTNINNTNKGTYVNFYFKNKKIALHRLLYSNFVAPLDSSEYLKFNCENKGICCNVYHYEKYRYMKSNANTEKKISNKKDNTKESKSIIIYDNDDQDLTVDFD